RRLTVPRPFLAFTFAPRAISISTSTPSADAFPQKTQVLIFFVSLCQTFELKRELARLRA
ncbi:MAG: hypothetical protein J5974_08145, partial [Pyramidobacter sp.]|nr:hypothetical protein [Pyramidobacter sp.]